MVYIFGGLKIEKAQPSDFEVCDISGFCDNIEKVLAEIRFLGIGFAEVEYYDGELKNIIKLLEKT